MLFEQVKHVPDVQQLEWFADSFNRADVIEEQLVITDLRMGFEDHYVFQHPVAEIKETMAGHRVIPLTQQPRWWRPGIILE